MKCPFCRTTSFWKIVTYGLQKHARLGGYHYIKRKPCKQDEADSVSEDFSENLKKRVCRVQSG